jgi:hypothetical protein
MWSKDLSVKNAMCFRDEYGAWRSTVRLDMDGKGQRVFMMVG